MLSTYKEIKIKSSISKKTKQVWSIFQKFNSESKFSWFVRWKELSNVQTNLKQ